MSREERKMAQIIASIERMEQDHSGGEGSRPGRKKGKKTKGTKARAGKKLRVSAVAAAVGKQPFESKLTPKKRWIQLWSAQLDEDKEGEKAPDQQEPEEEAPAVAESKETPPEPPTPVEKLEVTAPPPTASAVQNKPQVQVTDTPKAATAELRVKTPQNTESSHLSPPLDRNSPTTTASISPSAKVKESDAPNTNTAAVAASAAKFSPSAKQTQVERKEQASPPMLERKSSSSSSKGEEGPRRDCHERSRKRSLERSEPLSEEAKRRAERRRKRKSNWDVGDPRKGGSPVAIPDKTAASAAANQQSFAKYPPNRPSWRHSQSMVDMKPNFQSSHRSSNFYNSGSTSSRRGFYHSTSMPLDRSRSAGRSSARYSYGSSSSSNNNYR